MARKDITCYFHQIENPLEPVGGTNGGPSLVERIPYEDRRIPADHDFFKLNFRARIPSVLQIVETGLDPEGIAFSNIVAQFVPSEDVRRVLRPVQYFQVVNEWIYPTYTQNGSPVPINPKRHLNGNIGALNYEGPGLPYTLSRPVIRQSELVLTQLVRKPLHRGTHRLRNDQLQPVDPLTSTSNKPVPTPRHIGRRF